jgi:hypothetical protein
MNQFNTFRQNRFVQNSCGSEKNEIPNSSPLPCPWKRSQVMQIDIMKNAINKTTITH